MKMIYQRHLLLGWILDYFACKNTHERNLTSIMLPWELPNVFRKLRRHWPIENVTANDVAWCIFMLVTSYNPYILFMHRQIWGGRGLSLATANVYKHKELSPGTVIQRLWLEPLVRGKALVDISTWIYVTSQQRKISNSFKVNVLIQGNICF